MSKVKSFDILNSTSMVSILTHESNQSILTFMSKISSLNISNSRPFLFRVPNLKILCNTKLIFINFDSRIKSQKFQYCQSSVNCLHFDSQIKSVRFDSRVKNFNIVNSASGAQLTQFSHTNQISQF